MDAEELQRLRFDVGELMRVGMNIQLTPQTASALLAHIDAVTAERDALRALVERYGADQWRRGNAGKDPQEFAEWQREAQP